MMITISREELEEIQDISDLWDDSVREGYSGRGMYGKKCFGIVGGVKDLIQFIFAACRVLGDDVGLDSFSEPRTDSMGYDTIYYWPNVQVEKEEVVV